jgi:hypothetical protein
MTRDRTPAGTATAGHGNMAVAPGTMTPNLARETRPTHAPEGYARTVLHHAITQGDLLGEDGDGNVVIAIKLSPGDFDRLAEFDPDGDPDIER